MVYPTAITSHTGAKSGATFTTYTQAHLYGPFDSYAREKWKETFAEIFEDWVTVYNYNLAWVGLRGVSNQARSRPTLSFHCSTKVV